MKIWADKNTEGRYEFHLQNDSISYIIGVLKNGHLGAYYFGKRLHHRSGFCEMVQQPEHEVGVSPNPVVGEPGFSLDFIPREFPSAGQGDYRESAIEIIQPNGSRLVDFKYHEHQIIAGKKKLDGLPATYVENEDEATTLEIYFRDEHIRCELILSYTIFRNYPTITRSARVVNVSKNIYCLSKMLSMNIDLPHNDDCYSCFHLSGAWSRERDWVESNLVQGKHSIGSTRGLSSANHQPFIGIKNGHVTEKQGEVYGFSLIYSGNFHASAELNHYDQLRVNMGIHPEGFE